MALPTAYRRPLQDIKIFGVQHRATGERTKRPWIVRWSVDGPQRSQSFRTRTEAERFRSLLFEAQRRGEAFDPDTGEPVTWKPAVGDQPFHQWARRWLAKQWPEWQPRTRKSAVEALTRLVPLLVRSAAPAPPHELRAYLVRTLPPEAWVDVLDDRERWLTANAMPLSHLNRELLALVDSRLGVGDAGQPLAPSTAGRFRKVARACIGRAVDLEILSADPWPPISRGRRQRKAARVRRSVEVRRLPEPAMMAAAIEAIASHQPASRMYQTMTAVAYYAGLRPSEVVMLRPRALQLPATGWGRIDVIEADVSFDEPGEPKTGPRSVPIPPILVWRLEEWVRAHGFAPGELIFRTRSGRMPNPSNWSRALQRALRTIDQPSLRVYDCRHAAATTWLRAGVPLGEAARRLGHSVETLVSTYVGALADDEAVANERIAAVLACGR
jgi:integrase